VLSSFDICALQSLEAACVLTDVCSRGSRDASQPDRKSPLLISRLHSSLRFFFFFFLSLCQNSRTHFGPSRAQPTRRFILGRFPNQLFTLRIYYVGEIWEWTLALAFDMSSSFPWRNCSMADGTIIGMQDATLKHGQALLSSSSLVCEVPTERA
jgi:hypothetical protein